MRKAEPAADSKQTVAVPQQKLSVNSIPTGRPSPGRIPSAEWIFSTGVSIEGDEYNLRAPGTKQQYNARVQEIEGYVKAMLRVNDNFALWGRVGTTLAGQYDWSLNQGVGTPSADLNGALNAGAFFEAGIGLSF